MVALTASIVCINDHKKAASRLALMLRLGAAIIAPLPIPCVSLVTTSMIDIQGTCMYQHVKALCEIPEISRPFRERTLQNTIGFGSIKESAPPVVSP